jgi:hydroxymethylglutaryl-CoA lyase
MSSGSVAIFEEGPREGFQSEPPGIPTSQKIRLIEALAATGLSEINCCSFVDAARVPQMADAETIMAQLHRLPNVRYTGLWLNLKGFQRARASGADMKAVLVASASETFGLRNNNKTRAQLIDSQRALGSAYKDAGIDRVAGYVFTAFGCNYEGAIPVSNVTRSVQDLMTLGEECDLSFETMVLCDTIGVASPNGIARVIDAVRDRWPELDVALHLHDTRGMGMANALVGLQLGIRRFDASVAGLGGCPFAGNTAAAGNICTEDLVYLCHEEGFETGIDLSKLIACGLMAEEIVGRRLPGKIKDVRSL